MKIIFLIPARCESKRLPNKHLIKVNKNEFLWHMINSISKSKFCKSIKDIVICSYKSSMNYKLEEFAKKKGISIIYGRKNDIISRFYKAVNFFNADYFIQIDGDDPIIDHTLIDKLIRKTLKEKKEVGLIKNPIFGLSPLIVSRKGMAKVYRNYLTKNNHYGYRYYFIKSKICTKSVVNLHLKKIPDARLTLDNSHDVKFFRKVYSLNNNSLSFNMKNLVKFIKENKNIVLINLKYNEIYKNKLVKLYYRYRSKRYYFEI